MRRKPCIKLSFLNSKVNIKMNIRELPTVGT